ncbi:hypothetical protein [Streptomyces sp. NBC_01497]|uniref:hypothetical protein n=1 Tax=Streptomyces sp. NBC_01497 TaxID=2903885 RepID=UPI002E2F3B8C|nr:hypothetical protein [Streptomyces sp. NBC_01497]
MRLLVLGGTKYLGRHFVTHALSRGHDLTLFHRGRTGPALFPGVRRLFGDRDTDPRSGLAALRTGEWDAVVDFSGFLPRQVRATARLLAPRVRHYVLMSSIAVYPRSATAGRTEDVPLRRLDLPPGRTPEEVGSFTAQTYGPLKAAAERAAVEECDGRATLVRAGLVTGPGDPFGAFPGWALAMAGEGGRDGTVPCAARPGQPLQITDARDLAAFMVRMATVPLPGPYNVTAPPVTFATMLETCRAACGGTARVRWTGPWNEPGPRKGAEAYGYPETNGTPETNEMNEMNKGKGHRTPEGCGTPEAQDGDSRHAANASGVRHGGPARNVDEHAAGIVQPADGSDDAVFQLSTRRARDAGYRARPLADTARSTVTWALRTGAVFTSPH